jgi:hypothetical protein
MPDLFIEYVFITCILLEYKRNKTAAVFLVWRLKFEEYASGTYIIFV